MRELQEPLNTEERYLHGINIRLNVLIDMMSTFIKLYAEKQDVVTENNTEEFDYGEEIEEEVEEEVEEEAFDYNTLTKAQLIKELNIHGVYNTTSMLKAELVEQANKYL